MSPGGRRYFGCILPASLVVGGLLTCALGAYASQIIFLRRGITSDAMAPTLQPGWSVIVDSTAYWARNPFRGEVAWMETPEGRVFRRVIAVPGDTVAVRDGVAVVNGRAVREPYVRGRGPDYSETTVGTDEYFVMANDRDLPDSRQYGVVTRNHIFGSASLYSAPGEPGLQQVRHGGATAP